MARKKATRKRLDNGSAENLRASDIIRRNGANLPELEDRLRKAICDKIEPMRAHLAEVNAQFIERYGRPAPIGLRELEFEATRAGVPFSDIQDGSFASLLPYVQGHLQRLEDEERIAELKRPSATVANNGRVPMNDDKPRLSVDRERKEITFDGERYPVDDPDALELFEGMIANYPSPFNATSQENELRPSRINDRLKRGRTKPLCNRETGGTIWTAGRGRGGCRLLIDPR